MKRKPYTREYQPLLDPRIHGIFTHLSNTEKLLLHDLASNLSPGAIVVEIGSYLGASTCVLASGVADSGGKVYAVDTWTNIGMSEGPRNTYADFLRNTDPFRSTISPIRGFSVDVAEAFSEKIDLLFVDGDHSYEGVSADLQAWLPKLKERGIVVLHDFSWADGVRRATCEHVLPRQIEMGRTADTLYWSRVGDVDAKFGSNRFRASIVLVTTGRSVVLEASIQSLINQYFPRNEYEIIVVENSSQPTIRDTVKSFHRSGSPLIRYFHEEVPGLMAGRHRGAKEATGDILVFIDDDVTVARGWLRAVCDAFDDPDVHLAGGRSLPDYEAEPPSWVDILWKKCDDGEWCLHLSLLDFGDERRPVDPKFIWGLNFAIRRQTLAVLGGFHPDAVPWFLRRFRGDGETGLAYKASKLGLTAVYEPEALVHHYVPASRLTVRYLQRRSFLQGISDSYTSIRRKGLDIAGKNPKPSYEIIKGKIHNSMEQVLSFLNTQSGLARRMRRARDAGYAYHQNQVRRDATLLEWVLREHYWDYSYPLHEDRT